MDTANPSENAEQGHVIQMVTFTEPTDCFHCGKLLQGRFFQGMYQRGSVRAGATGAPVDFQKALFTPVNYPNTFKKKLK